MSKENKYDFELVTNVIVSQCCLVAPSIHLLKLLEGLNVEYYK